MIIVKPTCELWAQGQDAAAHVARCARVCYLSDKTTDNEKMVESLEKKGHLSMFRHESYYYHIPPKSLSKFSHSLLRSVITSAYCSYFAVRTKSGKPWHVFISTNGQFVREHPSVASMLSYFQVSQAAFVQAANDMPKRYRLSILMLLRHTVCLTTQISTSRELNRTSPNNIAEMSTRYVNFGKRGKGITICEPALWETWSWWQRARMKLAWKMSEWVYNSLTRHSMADENFNKGKCLAPQHARGVLPLDTATKVVYTYNGWEWKHIIDLRYYGTTGKPHPNAQKAIGMVYEEITYAYPELKEKFQSKEDFEDTPSEKPIMGM